MTEEPTYYFVKGKGWVPSIHEGEYICNYTDCAGLVWHIFKRTPKVGEFWDCLSPADDNLQQVLKWYDQTGNTPNNNRWTESSAMVYETYFVFERYD